MARYYAPGGLGTVLARYGQSSAIWPQDAGSFRFNEGPLEGRVPASTTFGSSPKFPLP
jgi:hypothetical protein